MATSKSQRVTIWIIAIVMTVGTLGVYFMTILASNNDQNSLANSSQQTQATQDTAEPQQVDPNAYIVKEKVMQVQVQDLTVGNGQEVKPNDTVTVHYKGTLATNGIKFDSSYDRGEPATLSLGQVIAGWQQGIPGMKVGGKRRLVIPATLAYGDKDVPGIPANSDLVFEVELLGVGDTAAASDQ